MGGFRALALTFVVLFAVIAAPASAHGDRDAHHSLREAVTDQNFYFVMADRFDNGNPLLFWTALFLKLGVSQIAVVPRPWM